MIATACLIALAATGLAILLNLYRLAIGPDVTDRVLALDTMVINAIGLIVLLGIYYGTTIYFEAAMLIAMVGFVTTVAFCKYLLRGNVIE
ncbi:MAG: K+/H+ antiporter subunit F [Bosea sp. (in: a-proteobacteria)]|uniref:K+/H+ antiporter subunit F n=1 Tax=Bosea sp. (in: a-proteobacteria) TaxID=1871050 RepID=UPI0027327570|nr:K+/H+ antiporter subunit F [Bosea sp. (in: a-proteobacteria)]MDP3257014.1 K+/H+ antiporter subunit F [Bosea sp. (in: a-proteobacteria)]MDP3319193.1 K+/H+ antiporter subunit F [Bosea sp. (in: a-proteobacteria)]